MANRLTNFRLLSERIVRALEKETPLVSVVIPCYNHAQFVQRTIQSVIDQDYKNIELIIIDDGSSDETANVIRRFIASCINRFERLEFRSRPNKGLTATLNEALSWCRGKYYSLIASDDIMMDRKISIQVDYLESNRECAAVFGGMLLINNEEGVVGKLLQEREHSFEELISLRNLPYTPSALLRASSIVAAGGYDEGVKIEDWDMWLKLSYAGHKLMSCNDIVVKYRTHPGNMSKQIIFMHEERMKILKKYEGADIYSTAAQLVEFAGLKSIAIRDAKYAIAAVCNSKSINLFQASFVFLLALSPRFVFRALRKWF